MTLEAEVALGKQRDGSLRNITAQPLTAYMLALEPMGAGSNLLDTRMPRP